MKQETLEEAAEGFWLNDDSMTDNDRISYVNGFLACTKWQQERSYSEEEVLKIFYDWDTFDYHQESFSGKDDLTFKQWFEQNKKK